jgi:hypothetical protein
MIYTGQNSFRLVLDTTIDITGASSISIRYASPTLSTGSYTATALVSTAGTMFYDFTSTDSLAVGVWVFWAYVKHVDTRVSIGDPVAVTVRTEGSLI